MTAADPSEGYDELYEPLALALGHLVFAAALLEKAMLSDLIQRRIIRDGAEEVFGQQLVSRLERKAAGVLLPELRRMGYDEKLAGEITAVIEDRNRFIHHLFEEPEFIRSLGHRHGVGEIVCRVEALVGRIDRVVKKLQPEVTSGMEEMFGGSAVDLLGWLRTIDANEFEEDGVRSQLEALQGVPDDFLDGGAGPEG